MSKSQGNLVHLWKQKIALEAVGYDFLRTGYPSLKPTAKRRNITTLTNVLRGESNNNRVGKIIN